MINILSRLRHLLIRRTFWVEEVVHVQPLILGDRREAGRMKMNWEEGRLIVGK